MSHSLQNWLSDFVAPDRFTAASAFRCAILAMAVTTPLSWLMLETIQFYFPPAQPDDFSDLQFMLRVALYLYLILLFLGITAIALWIPLWLAISALKLANAKQQTLYVLAGLVAGLTASVALNVWGDAPIFDLLFTLPLLVGGLAAGRLCSKNLWDEVPHLQ